MWCLTIDLGATFIKGAAVNLADMRLEHVCRRPFPGFAPDRPPGWREVPVDAILREVSLLVDELLARAPQAEAIFWCGQMHGLILCDEHGAARSDFISWQDQRSVSAGDSASAGSFATLAARVSESDRAALGREFSPRHPVANLHWLAAHGRLPTGTFAGSLVDYVIAAVTRSAPRLHPTNASGLGLYAVGEGRWHESLIGELGLAGVRWPEIVGESEPLGEWVCRGRRLRCYPAIGDQQAALLGVGLEPGELSLNIATGSQVSGLTSDRTVGNFQLRPYLGGRYLRTVTHLPAGRALNALVGLLGELAVRQGTPVTAPWELIADAVRETPATDLRADISFFSCATGTVGQLGGLHEENLRVGHVFVAAFAAMAANYEAAALRLQPARDWSRLVFSGGLVQKLPALRTQLVGRLGPKWRLADEAEDTLVGLAKVARQALR